MAKRCRSQEAPRGLNDGIQHSCLAFISSLRYFGELKLHEAAVQIRCIHVSRYIVTRMCICMVSTVSPDTLFSTEKVASTLPAPTVARATSLLGPDWQERRQEASAGQPLFLQRDRSGVPEMGRGWNGLAGEPTAPRPFS